MGIAIFNSVGALGGFCGAWSLVMGEARVIEMPGYLIGPACPAHAVQSIATRRGGRLGAYPACTSGVYAVGVLPTYLVQCQSLELRHILRASCFA